jgi:hypothetical protein
VSFVVTGILAFLLIAVQAASHGAQTAAQQAAKQKATTC